MFSANGYCCCSIVVWSSFGTCLRSTWHVPQKHVARAAEVRDTCRRSTWHVPQDDDLYFQRYEKKSKLPNPTAWGGAEEGGMWKETFGCWP